MIKNKEIKPSTIVRCVLYVMVLINQLLAVFGTALPFTSNFVYQTISVLLTISVGIWTAWKNNDFTKFAVVAGKVFDALKDGTVSIEEAENLIKEADKTVEENK